jgi:hypothetical protein
LDYHSHTQGGEMIFRDQITLGKLPIILVMVTLLVSIGLSAISYVLLATHPGIVQRPEVHAPILIPVKRFDPEYHRAIGQKFIMSFGCWNRFNLERQMVYAISMADESIHDRLRAEYSRESDLAKKMKISRQTVIEDVSQKWVEPKTGESQFSFLVRVNEWWGGTAQDPRWFLYHIQIRDVEPTTDTRIVALVTGFVLTDITDRVLKDRQGDPSSTSPPSHSSPDSSDKKP